MPDTKLSGLTKITSACSVDLVYLAHDPAGTIISAGISASSLFQSIPGTTGLVIGSDTNLYRGAANQLKTDDSFISASNINLSTDAGKIQFGATLDANLYRAWGNTLQTDGNLRLGAGSLTIANDSTSYKLFFGATPDTNIYRYANNVLKTDSAMTIVGLLTLGAGITFDPDTNIYRDGVNILKTDDSFTSASNINLNTDAGKIQFGAAGDVNLYRQSSTNLKTDDEFQAVGSVWTLDGSLIIYNTTGWLKWYDGVSSFDTNLYRSATSTLKTDGMFIANTNIMAVNDFQLWTAGKEIQFGDTAGGYDTNLFRLGSDQLATSDAFFVGNYHAGTAGYVGFTNEYDESLSSGFGTVKMLGTTARNNSGWLTILAGTGVRYIPYWTTIG